MTRTLLHNQRSWENRNLRSCGWTRRKYGMVCWPVNYYFPKKNNKWFSPLDTIKINIALIKAMSKCSSFINYVLNPFGHDNCIFIIAVLIFIFYINFIMDRMSGQQIMNYIVKQCKQGKVKIVELLRLWKHNIDISFHEIFFCLLFWDKLNHFQEQ